MLYMACANSWRREWWRKQAAVILIACLPPGYGSEIEPRKKNVAAGIQCNFTVLILSGTERVKLLFFASWVWIGGKERIKKREQEDENSFLSLNTKPEYSVKRKGKKPWLLSTVGRNNTLVWLSLAHQAAQTTEAGRIAVASWGTRAC